MGRGGLLDELLAPADTDTADMTTKSNDEKLKEWIESRYEPVQYEITHPGDYRGEDYKVTIISEKFIGHDYVARATTFNKELVKIGVPFIHPNKLELLTPRDMRFRQVVMREGKITPIAMLPAGKMGGGLDDDEDASSDEDEVRCVSGGEDTHERCA